MRSLGLPGGRAPSIAGMLKRSFNLFAVLLVAATCIGVASFGLVLLGIYPTIDRYTQAQLVAGGADAAMSNDETTYTTALASGNGALAIPGADSPTKFEMAGSQLQRLLSGDAVALAALKAADDAAAMWRTQWVGPAHSIAAASGAVTPDFLNLGGGLFQNYTKASSNLEGVIQAGANTAHNNLTNVAAFAGIIELVLFVAMVVIGRRQDESLKDSVVAPVDELRRAIRALRDGHLSEPIESSGPLELRQIGDGLREMAAALAHEREQGLAREAELSLQADRLREAQRAAEQASNAKSEFLARMSHELRTPLTAIIGFSELMELDEATPSQRASIASILRASNHLLTLVNDVLDITRVEAGRMAVLLGPVHPASVVDETLDLAAPLARTRSIVVNRRRGLDRAPEVVADHQRLKQVLLNLVVNAVKYNRFGGDVEVGAEWDRRQVLFEVKDTGAGIKPENVAKLFSPFERLQADLSDIPGSGLGLALSRSLVRAMGGSIGVRSRVGMGSTFWVLLPRETPEPEPAGLELTPAERPQHAPSLARLALPLDAREYETTKTLLYVEDTFSNVTLVRQILTRRPHIELISAMYGSLAVELAAEHQPDMIILDVHRADFGSAMIRRLKMEARTRTIPVAVLSSDTTPDEDERLREAGAVECLPQPVNVRRFLALLDEHLVDSREAPFAAQVQLEGEIVGGLHPAATDASTRAQSRRSATDAPTRAQSRRSATTTRDGDSGVAR